MASMSKDQSSEVKKLIEAYRNARDEQRTATESPMVESSSPGDRMQEIADKLEKLGIDPSEIDDEGASTL